MAPAASRRPVADPAAGCAPAAPVLVTHAATPDRWPDLQTVMTTTGDSGRCWCQWFRCSTADWQGRDRSDHRTQLRAQVDEQSPPGVIGYLDGEPVAWCALAPRPSYLRLRRSRKLTLAGVADDLDDDTIWSVTCFVVRAPFRRHGLSRRLLETAVIFAADHGARIVEGYPVDLAQRTTIAGAELFVGTLTTFLAVGFTEVGRSAPARPVVRRSVP
ncbi:MAG: GNAT family N-acetyltransferase [Kineosporiaceae bacterium]|nr:GNAT family N-acetyltransferase [Kineosporiaceae bacterium]